MTGIEANPKTQPEIFQHSPLPKVKGSFRLIQVRPDFSVDGLPDCYLQNALVQESNYVCLSYTWGEPGDEFPIKLDGKLHYVRQNLYDFLQAARQRLTFCTLWIDALCINQANIEKRNHQVQQMGDIFAGARLVVSWLGNNFETQEFVQAVGQKFDRQAWKTWEDFYHSKHGDSPQGSSSQNAEPDSSSRSVPAYDLSQENTYDSEISDSSLIERHYDLIANNAYWQRAWVAQEMMLANALVVMAGIHVIDFLPLAYYCVHSTKKLYFSSIMEYAYLLYWSQEDYLENGPSCSILQNGRRQATHGLIYLLRWFQGKCCTLRRDRIYSLLALCKGGDKVRVDYDGPDTELIMQVLDACKEEMCFCTAAIVARIVKGPDFSHLEQETYAITVTHDFKLQAYSSDLGICPSCSQQVPQSRPGVYFCLHCSSDVCQHSQGHLFWDNTSRDDVVDRFRRRAGLLWLARYDLREPRVLCRPGQGIEINREEVEGEFYTLRFSLGTLVDVKGVEFETKSRFIHRTRVVVDHNICSLA